MSKLIRAVFISWASLAAACSAQYHYLVEAETPRNVEAVRGAKSFYARPLVVSFVPPSEWDVSELAWAEHVAEMSKWYDGWVVGRTGQDTGVEVARVEANTAVTEGVVLEMDIYKIDKGDGWGWKGMGVSPDIETAWARVTLRAPTGEVLYESQLRARAEIGRASGLTFEQRIKWVVWHYTNAVRDLLLQGALGEGERTEDGPRDRA